MALKKRGKIWWIDFCHKGERVRRSTGTTNRVDAQQLHDQLKAQLWKEDNLNQLPKKSWKDAALRWLEESSHKGRSQSDLAQYLQSLPGKERVKVVCIDLSSTYRTIIKQHFPNAKIVADRFHVIRLVQHQCMMTYRELADNIKHNRGLLALLRSRPDNLSIESQPF